MLNFGGVVLDRLFEVVIVVYVVWDICVLGVYMNVFYFVGGLFDLFFILKVCLFEIYLELLLLDLIII